MSTIGLSWAKRSMMAWAPKSAEHELHTAPTCAVARASTTVSMRFGTMAAMRSPSPIPCAASAAAVRLTRSLRVCQLSSSRLPVSSRQMSAGDASCFTNKLSVKLSVPSGNQRAPGKVSSARAARPGVPRTLANCHNKRQNAGRSAMLQACSAA